MLSSGDLEKVYGFLRKRIKAWIYQHSIRPRILWPLLVYKEPITTVEALERKISSYWQRWLGLPRSLSSATLYGTSNVLQLLISSLAEEFMVSRTWKAWQCGASRDPKVATAGIQVRTGRRWSAEKSLEVAESQGAGGAHSNRACRHGLFLGNESRQCSRQRVSTSGSRGSAGRHGGSKS